MSAQDHITSEEFSQDSFFFEEEKPLHHYRTEIPNCLDDAGLDPYEFRVYAHIKRIAGDKGSCFKSYENIGQHCGISRRKTFEIIQKLCEKNEVLGIPLLKKNNRKRPDGGDSTCIFVITDIWKYNSKYYSGSARNAQGECTKCTGGGAPGAHLSIKKEPIVKKEPEEEESSASQNQIISLNTESRKFVGISVEILGFWKQAYDKINILEELKQCLVKALTLEKRSDWTSFILNWLQNSQNSAKEVKKISINHTEIEKKLREFVSNINNNKFNFIFHEDRMEYINKAINFARVIFYDTVEFNSEFQQLKKNIGI